MDDDQWEQPGLERASSAEQAMGAARVGGPDQLDEPQHKYGGRWWADTTGGAGGPGNGEAIFQAAIAVGLAAH